MEIQNQCYGIYGKCLNVKITNYCPGACNFCIEKNGYKPKSIDVNELILRTNNLIDYQTVLILGGEPFAYPHLEKYLSGLNKKEVYVTTNGSVFNIVNLKAITKYITGINISIHSYIEEENNSILHTKVNFNDLKTAINIFQSNNVPVRFNTILLKNGISNKQKMLNMIDFAKAMNVTWIRFSELQFATEDFVFAKDIFDGINKNPFFEGCNQELLIDPKVQVTVRQSCGIVNTLKEFPDIKNIPRKKADSLIMYPNGEIFDGWLVPKNYKINNTQPCENVIEVL